MGEKSKIYNFYLMTKGGIGILKGKSMYPALKEGWKAKVEPSDESKIQVRDIVVFGRDNFTCHRVIEKIKFFGQYYFIHKGDNSSIGGIFEAKDLIGKVADVFDEDGRKIDNIWWSKVYLKNKKFLGYFYFIMHLIKRYIWADEANRLTRLLNRLFWKFF